MDKKMNFKYFYGTEADQFSFYRIPKALFTNDCFKDLSCDAKILYGLMLDRMSLSIKNQWFDEENRAYIYFSIEDIMELLNCGRNKAVKSLQELDDEKGIGLIEKRRQGFGKVTIIYVKSFVQEECEEQKKEKSKMVKFINQTSVEEEETEEVYISNFKKSQKQTSRSPENKLLEVYISNPNNTNLSDTSVAPIPFATMSNREWGQIGTNYFRGLFALAFQAFLMMVCVAIYAVLVAGIQYSDNLSSSLFGVMAYTVILCFSLFKTGSLSKSIFNAH